MNGPDPRLIKTPDDFARSLRELRRRSGLSLRALAVKLRGMSPDAPSFTTLGGWFKGDHLPTAKLAASAPHLLALCGVTGDDEVAQWLAALERVRSQPGPRPAGSPAPFRGLAVYEPGDARYFYGRDALTAELLSVVERRSRSGGLVAVVGPSGSGKSSLLRAGLIPALDRDNAPAVPGPWCSVLFTPGPDPLRELARNIADLAGAPAEIVEAKLLTDPRSAADLVRRTVAGQRLLIVVDQFEELFTAETDQARRSGFIGALCAMTRADPRSAKPPPALVVVGLRADFYAQAFLFADLVPALRDAQVVVGPMTADELRAAITQPPREVKSDVDDGLVELLMRELAPPRGGVPGAAHEVGALPLLSHALLATWEHAKARTLTVEHYVATGGIHGAIAMTADRTFAGLSPAQRETARRLFVRLVRIGDDVADTRRKVPRNSLIDSGDGPGAPDAGEVLDRFVAARLVTVNDDTVEMAHEALLTAWPLLRTWLSTDRSWLGTHLRLGTAATEWAQHDRDPDLLYRGAALHVAQEQALDGGRAQELNALEREFLDAGLVRQARDRRAQRRRARRPYQVGAALATVVIIATSLVAYFRQQALARERQQARTLLSRLVASEADRVLGQDVSLGTQLALAAYRIAPTPQARSSLLNATDVPAATELPASAGPVNEVAATDHGGLLAVGTDPGTVELWRISPGGHLTRTGPVLRGPEGSVNSLAFSPDGHVLAAGGIHSQGIYLWDTASPAQSVGVAALPHSNATQDAIVSIAISPDGQTLAASLGDSVGLWDIANPAHPALLGILRGPTDPVTSLAFTPDGRTLAAGSDDGRVHLWNVTNPAHPVPLRPLTGPSSHIFSIAISPDGRYLAAGTGAQHDVYLWNIADPGHARAHGAPLAGPGDWVNSVAFSPDGRSLAAGSSDNQLWLYNLATRTATEQLPHPNPVTGVVYLGDHSLVTVSNNGTNGAARLWQVPGPVITGAKDEIFAVSYDASGAKLGIGPGSLDNTVTVWGTTSIQHPAEIGPHLVNFHNDGGYSGSGTLTPNGDTFVVGCVDGTVQLWNITDPAHPSLYGSPLQAATPGVRGLVESVNVSDNGRLLAVSSDDGAVHLWNIASPRHPVQLTALRTHPVGKIYAAAFSSDSHLLAEASTNDNVYLWNIASPRHPHLLATLRGFTEAAYSVVFANGGRLLAAGSADDTVRLWDITRPAHPVHLTTLTGPLSTVYSLAFDPSRDVLAAGSTDSTTWLWNLADPRHPAYLATLTGPSKGVFTVAFSPNGRTLAAGGVDHTVHLWDTDPRSAAASICAAVGRPMTKKQWRQFVPTLPYSPPCQ